MNLSRRLPKYPALRYRQSVNVNRTQNVQIIDESEERPHRLSSQRSREQFSQKLKNIQEVPTPFAVGADDQTDQRSVYSRVDTYRKSCDQKFADRVIDANLMS